MKRKILYIVSFLLILFILDRAWKFSLFSNLNLKTTYISKGEINSEILFLGPCISLWMMEPDTIKKYTGLKTYNLSTSNSNLAENFAMLYLYLKHNKAPQHLFLCLNHESFDRQINLFNTWNFCHFMDDTVINRIVKEEDRAYYTWSRMPFIKYAWYNHFTFFESIQGLKHAITGKDKPYHSDGFELPVSDTWDGSFEKFVKKYPNGKKYAWNSDLEKYCRRIIQIAKAKGVKITLYDPPVYKAALPYYINRREIQEKINRLAKEESIAYWQFDSLQFTSEKHYFITSYNTTRKGSALFMMEFVRFFMSGHNSIK